MRKLFIASFILFATSNAFSQQVTCPALPAEISCDKGVWHTKMNPLPDSFELADNEVEGKPCKAGDDRLVFEKAFEAYQGWGVSCTYIVPDNDSDFLYIMSSIYQHDGANWSFDYNWRWRCFGPEVNNCEMIPF